MKRIIFCFDGTWNRIDAEHPTNVLYLATSIAPRTEDGISQIVHYDDGVGTGLRDKASGGITGYGLFKNIEEAYRFLIFNYEPGDEVFAFGFSRGAFTARSFIGFVRTVGIIQRHHTRQIKKAIKLYKSGGSAGYKVIDALDRLDFRQKYSSHISVCKEDEEYRCKVDEDYIPGQSYPFSFRYVGLWDTVETLGLAKVIWQHLPIVGRRPYTGRDHRYHKHKLLGMVSTGRHAVALDERRRNFDVEPWGDIESYNKKLGFEPQDEDKPFQEKFFPGTHGSVGGGGIHKGLSDAALVWVMRGANDSGLVFDTSASSSLYQACPIFTDPLDNQHGHKKRNFKEVLMKMRPRWRTFRPETIQKVYVTAQYRWAYKGELVEGIYRPQTLEKLKAELNKLTPIAPISRKFMSGLISESKESEKAIYYTVKRGDTLGKIAKEKLGDASLYQEIFEANRGMVENPDLIYIGQVLRIPLRQNSPSSKIRK